MHFYSDNHGLCPKRFILSYTNEMQYILEKDNDQNQLIRVDENDEYSAKISTMIR